MGLWFFLLLSDDNTWLNSIFMFRSMNSYLRQKIYNWIVPVGKKENIFSSIFIYVKFRFTASIKLSISSTFSSMKIRSKWSFDPFFWAKLKLNWHLVKIYFKEDFCYRAKSRADLLHLVSHTWIFFLKKI